MGDVDMMARGAEEIASGHHAELDLSTGVLEVRVPADQVESFVLFVRERFGVEVVQN